VQVLLGRRARESEERAVLARRLLGEVAVERLGVGGLARLEKLEDARAKSDRDAHDDALGRTRDGVGARVHGCVEQVIRRLLERGEHQDGLLHLGHAKARDPEHFAAEAHDVGEQRHVARVHLWDREGAPW